jgi:hypothetical protein
MVFKEHLRETPEYQAATADSTGQGNGQATTQSGGQDPVEAPVPGEVRPIVSLEKGDLEFWLRVVTVVLLYMILQELKEGQ